MPVTKNAIIADRYQILNKIGEGSFGEVFLTYDRLINKYVAVKTKSMTSNYPEIAFEAYVMQSLTDIGFGKFYGFGQVKEYSVNYIVSELMGPSLEDLFDLCGRKFTLKTSCILMHQLVRNMKYMYSKNLIHRDIKPDNFLMGLAESSSIVHTIDFGLSKKYRNA